MGLAARLSKHEDALQSYQRPHRDQADDMDEDNGPKNET